MISYGNYNLENMGLRIKSVKGLFDFPQLKSHGVEWDDEDYIQPHNRIIDYQYGPRKITLDCYMKGDSWSQLRSRLYGLKNWITSIPRLKMLVLTDYSTRGHMCYLQKDTILKPVRYYENGKSVALFKLTFEEPQPFNVQLTFINTLSSLTTATITVMKLSKSLDLGSDKQRYINAYIGSVHRQANLEQENLELSFTFNPGQPTPFIITGEVDSIERIGLSISGTGIEVYNVDTANYFLRNGIVEQL